ncbi:MAG: hypothetical protein WC695_04275 [Candidatus Omnitrophota bacterium]
MIRIDFSLAITFYLLLPLAVIFILWLKRVKHKEKDLFLNPKFIWFCSICTYTYINTKEAKISTCPRCGSFNAA